MGRTLKGDEYIARRFLGLTYSDAASDAKIARQALVDNLDFAFECEVFITVPDGVVTLVGTGLSSDEAVRRAVAKCVANWNGRRWIGVQAVIVMRFSNGFTIPWPLDHPRLDRMVHLMNFLFPETVMLDLTHAESLRLWRSVKKKSDVDDSSVADRFVTSALRAVLAAARREKVDVDEWVRKTIAIG